MDTAHSPRWLRAGAALRWVLPLAGSLGLPVPGLMIVDMTVAAGHPAINPVSVGLYTFVVALYGVLAWVVHSWLRPGRDRSSTAGAAAIEAAVVGFLVAPTVGYVALFLVIVSSGGVS